MSEIKTLQQERINICRDIHDSKIPKRVPIQARFLITYVAQFGGVDMALAQWNPSTIEHAADRLCNTIFTDYCPFDGAIRFPSFYQTLRSKSFVMGSNGFIQHPEVVGMLSEDYDYLIEKPFDCLIERVIPRLYPALDLGDPVRMAMSLATSLMGYENDYTKTGNIISRLVEKYGYGPGIPPSANGFTAAPFDFIADQLRGFKEISMDVRRIPEKLAEACEAVYPIMFKKGLPSKPADYSSVFLPLHMPTYMREKDFAKLWWPSFKRMIDEYASLGIQCKLYCEDDWTRYLDYLYELPTNTILVFEYGDPRQIKEKLGKKHIITGLYPLTMLQSHTKEQCINKAMELVDILAPGGKYYFTPDKSILSITDVNLENFCAVTEFLREYAVYPNPGGTFGLKFSQADYKVDPASARKLESKYFTDWKNFEALYPQTSEDGIQMLQGFEDRLFQYLIFLLL